MTEKHYTEKILLFLSLGMLFMTGFIALGFYEEIVAKKKVIPDLCENFINGNFQTILTLQIIVSVLFLLFFLIYFGFKLFGKLDKIKLGDIDEYPKLLRTLVVLSLLLNLTFLVLYISYTTTFEVCFPNIDSQLDQYKDYKNYMTWVLIILSIILLLYLFYIYKKTYGKEDKGFFEAREDKKLKEKDVIIKELQKKLEKEAKESNLSYGEKEIIKNLREETKDCKKQLKEKEIDCRKNETDITKVKGVLSDENTDYAAKSNRIAGILGGSVNAKEPTQAKK
jgi:NADH:ubiquinone oxidoreductase subunit 5 (subunit L)/multisubunit Na+/H+ antiporter MnhA subunit